MQDLQWKLFKSDYKLARVSLRVSQVVNYIKYDMICFKIKTCVVMCFEKLKLNLIVVRRLPSKNTQKLIRNVIQTLRESIYGVLGWKQIAQNRTSSTKCCLWYVFCSFAKLKSCISSLRGFSHQEAFKNFSEMSSRLGESIYNIFG